MKSVLASSGVQLVLLILVIAAVGYAVLQPGSGNHPAIIAGQAAPNFSLTALNGQKVQLSDYRGKGVLLNFWASWCDPCVNELPLMNEAYKQMKGVKIVAVNVGEKEETVRKFADRYDLAFPILLDQENSVKQQYNVSGLPVTLLIDEKGIIVEILVGQLDDFAEILRLMERVQPEPAKH